MSAQAFDQATAMEDFFRNWPEEIPKRGVLVTMTGDQIPFRAFLLTKAMVLFERTAPDPMGARLVAMPFGQVAAIKIVDVLRQEQVTAMGFEGKLSGK